MHDDSLFAFAGDMGLLEEPARRIVETCSITVHAAPLTTTPNRLMVDVHDRMPVILPGWFSS